MQDFTTQDLKRTITMLVVKPRNPEKEFTPRTVAEIAEIAKTTENTVSNCIAALKKTVDPNNPQKLQLTDIVYISRRVTDLKELIEGVKDGSLSYGDMFSSRQKIYFLLLKPENEKGHTKVEIANKTESNENNINNSIHVLKDFAKKNPDILKEEDIKYVGKRDGTFQEFLEDLLS